MSRFGSIPLWAWLLFLLTLILLGTYFWSRRKIYLFAAKLPGPTGLPLLGSGMKFICDKKELVTPYSCPSKLWIGPELLVVIKDPKQLQIVLQSSSIITKAKFYRILEEFLGQGLVTSTGSLHKRHKQLLQPIFSQRMIDSYSHLFQKHAGKFVQEIDKHADGCEFDIIPYLHDSMFESTMDLLLEDENNHSIDYKDVPGFVKRFYELGFARLRTFWLHFDFIYHRTANYREISEMKEIANTMIEEIMNTTVKKVLQRLESGSEVSKDKEKRALSVLEMIVEIVLTKPESLSVQHSIDHLMSLMGASQDTSSSGIAFTCMMLGAYPHIQDLVVEEIREVLGNKTTLDFTDVSKLEYLEMCLKETLRLFAIVPVVFRQTTDDFQLGDVTIPKGLTVALSIYHAHRDPNHWEKPNEFYPEHFTPEAVSKRHPFAFIPFSAGPRKCLAQLYAYTNMKIFIANILLKYKLESSRKVEDLKLTADISLRPTDGYFLKIRPRI